MVNKSKHIQLFD